MEKSYKIAQRRAARARKFAKLEKSSVVATAHTRRGLQLAARLHKGEVDIIEIRVDALLAAGISEGYLARSMEKIALPRLVTVRHPTEGGIGGLSMARRRELLAKFLPCAELLDIELRSLAGLAGIARQATAQGVRVVVSDHYFRATPPLTRLFDRQRRAFQAGADIFKIAALASSPQDLIRLLEFCRRPAPGPHAVMGMGAFGPVSRLALAKAGSVLNYGYLDRPNAPGQWEARELKALLLKS